MTPIPDLISLFVSIPPAIAMGVVWYTLLRRFTKNPQKKFGRRKELKAANEPTLLLSETKPAITPNASIATSTPTQAALRLPLDPLMGRCACGLELSETSMLEHVESTGHSGISAAVPIRVGKIWDLQEAVIERASPACFRCGKPVQGLKRVGKTIYVSHSGCQQREKPEKVTGSTTPAPKASHPKPSPARRPRTITNCPICWKPSTGRKGIAQIPSATGGRIRFHEECLNYS